MFLFDGKYWIKIANRLMIGIDEKQILSTTNVKNTFSKVRNAIASAFSVPDFAPVIA